MNHDVQELTAEQRLYDAEGGAFDVPRLRLMSMRVTCWRTGRIMRLRWCI